MYYKGMILTGPAGSGKSVVGRELCKKHKTFQIVEAVTTRKPRDDDWPGQYEYLNNKEFTLLEKTDQLLIRAKYRGEDYGITKKSLETVVRRRKTPIVITTPDSVPRLSDEDSLSIFLDAPDKVLEKRLRDRGEKMSVSVKQQKEQDRKCIEFCLYAIKNVEIEKTTELIWCLWKYRNTGGVLSKRIIRLMIDCDMLLENARHENIQGASYDLSLGDEYYSGGRIQKLTDETPFLLIEPYDYAIATSKENVNFPRDICGRFDLSVGLFCQGVILSNGPQVDPGFKGKLFCLLFNTSNAPVVLKQGQHYATLEFNKLIEPTPPYEGRYQSKLKIINYLPSNTLRGAVSELRKELEKVRSESAKLQTIILGTIGVLLTVIALLLTLQ